MRRAALGLTMVLASCSREEKPIATVPDAYVETEAPDTEAVDAVTEEPADTAPRPCITPLDAGFTCRAPSERAGHTVCNDAALEAVLVCFGTDTKACSDATAKYPACSMCVRDWLQGDRIDFGACVAALDKAGTCPTTVQCTLDCLDAVCATCDLNAGTGSTPSRSARDDCERTASATSGGACWELAGKDYTACATDATLAVCFPKGLAELRAFFRGACRDGGDWSRAFEEEKSDAAMD